MNFDFDEFSFDQIIDMSSPIVNHEASFDQEPQLGIFYEEDISPVYNEIYTDTQQIQTKPKSVSHVVAKRKPLTIPKNTLFQPFTSFFDIEVTVKAIRSHIKNNKSSYV